MMGNAGQQLCQHPHIARPDQACADFYAIESELDIIKAQLALLPTRKELARIGLGVIFGAAGLVILWMETFWRHGP
jgi:hypothetical protein